MTTSLSMGVTQLTSANGSSPWLPGGAAPEQESAEAAPAMGLQAVRRQRFANIVKRAMLALTAFTLLGLGRFAWQRQQLAAELKTAVVTSTAEAGSKPPPRPEPTPVMAASAAAPPIVVAATPPSEPAVRAVTATSKLKGKGATNTAPRRKSVFLTGTGSASPAR